MKFGVGQKVVLLTTEGKPVSGDAFILSRNSEKHTYTVSHKTESTTETYENIPEDRIVPIKLASV